MSRPSPRARACLAALLGSVVIAAAPAGAADMAPYNEPRIGSPYDDPRYNDIFRHPAPPPRYAEPRYEPPRRYEPAPDYRYDYHRPEYWHEIPRDRYGRLEPMRPPADAWRWRERRFSRDGRECTPRREVQRMLTADGWGDFQDAELDGDTAIVRARRPSGRQYELRIDRCTGDILHAQPLDRGERHYSWRARRVHRGGPGLRDLRRGDRIKARQGDRRGPCGPGPHTSLTATRHGAGKRAFVRPSRR